MPGKSTPEELAAAIEEYRKQTLPMRMKSIAEGKKQWAKKKKERLKYRGSYFDLSKGVADKHAIAAIRFIVQDPVPQARRQRVKLSDDVKLVGWRGVVNSVKDVKDGQVVTVTVRPEVESTKAGVAFLSVSFEETWKLTDKKMECKKCVMKGNGLLIFD